MPLRSLFLFLLFFFAFLFIGYLNREPFQLVYYPGYTLSVAPVLLILGAFIAGVFSVFLVSFVNAYHSSIEKIKNFLSRKRKEKNESFLKRGTDAAAVGNMKLAESLYLKILRTEPQNLFALLSLGILKRENGELKEAIRLHAKARLHHPDNPDVSLALAKDYIAAGAVDDAIEILQDLVRKHTTSLAVLTEANKIYLAQKQWKLLTENQKRIVAITYNAEEKKEATKELARYVYEHVLARWVEDDLEDLDDLINEGIYYDENFMPLRLTLGEYFIRIGKEKKAIKTWWKAYTLSSQLIFLQKIEHLYRQNNETDKIFKLYSDALDYAEENPIVYLLAGKIFLEYEKPDLALQTIERSKKYFGNSVAYNLALYESLRNFGKQEEAEAVSLTAVKESWNTISCYRCSGCSASFSQWQVRCPQCGQLDTLHIVRPSEINDGGAVSLLSSGRKEKKETPLQGEVLLPTS